MDRYFLPLKGFGLALLFVNSIIFIPARAWDSKGSNPTHSTHSYLTEWALDQLQVLNPELSRYRKEIIEGSNQELHEIPVSGAMYQIDLESKRVQRKGTNEGCEDIKGYWDDSLHEYRKGNKEAAYFLLGIMLHMVQDMGVPAHAHRVYHQGTVSEFDNFEFMALLNWKPRFSEIGLEDPLYADPWRYYYLSESWTRLDVPSYKSRNEFSKFWITSTSSEKRLLGNRQGRTAVLTKWAIESALRNFGQKE